MNPSAPRGYILVQKIGSGAFASVWRGIESSTKKDVAIKIISKQKVRDKSVVMNEVKILKEIKKINNKGLIDFIDFKDDLKNYFIITELYLNGSLTNKIRQAGILSENSARHIFIQVASALRCLHEELQIAHRDVKLDNIVFDDDNNAKLIDFGLSIEYTNASPYLSHACGSPSMNFCFYVCF
ncbi:hypothetical protein TRFO_12954 [Tritrichomonas foetus]|uniref:Protein kinase domain-containing protein n=1 Tax=Tritrichomonas foetus TaxID=1144522 RepID=A0A1J4L421_9EUKA|nr:hypothetical protein TRFO_12954 [Tritrichomonas foetus]|eukprot:OHT16702.1 hypothetical protein TRFO_12954 [Tritrichomonas foetus]